MEDRIRLEHVPIQDIKPNPLNPRRDHSVQTDEMQKIIKERGWETGITCYNKDGKYYILSGHRRWYAATQIGEKKIPVFVVPKPESQLEELERLGSSQSGKVDWSPYEWARYTFDLWTLRNKCSYRELSHKLRASENMVAARINVFRYYPHTEIEEQLEDGTLTISVLADIIGWIQRLKKNHKGVIDELSEDFIRSNMVKKAEKKRFAGLELRTDKFTDLAEDEHIITFIRDVKMKLSDAYKLLGEEDDRNFKGSRTKQSINMLTKRQKEVSYMDAEKPEDAKEIYHMLEQLKLEIDKKKEELSFLVK